MSDTEEVAVEEEVHEEEAEPEPEPETEPEPEPEPEPEVKAEIPKHKIHVPPPAAPEGPPELVFDDMHRKRMEKDLSELQTLIDAHFETRKKEEEDLLLLKERIEKRRQERDENIRQRAEKEKERQQRIAEEKARREEEDQRKRAEEDHKKRRLLTDASATYGSTLSKAERGRKGKKVTEREKKRKILGERRKALNIDHLSEDKLKEKATELWEWLHGLESEKFDLLERIKRQKYDIQSLNRRVDELNAKGRRGKGKGAAARKK
ncbi:unnamed protein product [Lampetra fluviatilis]